ncbi:DUF5908 family protein [Roseateles sp.]|uniref:DUF5908 family protein n=1 Tax=Roseateles sp. TaxID=1971397 RepID=UPI003D09DB7F
MTLEVRQLLLKSTVSDDEADDEASPSSSAAKSAAGGCGGGGAGEDCEDREQLKEEILAECRVWLLAQLQALRER